MINQIKENIKSKLNKKVNLIINEGRSKKIKCFGTIKEVYSNIFMIEIDGYTYSYSFTDVLTKKIIIK